jgi:hypothetical protein
MVNDFANEIKYYGVTIIHEDYFTQYVEDYCKELGYISDDLPSFIEYNIDWDGVAEDFMSDYACVDYDGASYYVR